MNSEWTSPGKVMKSDEVIKSDKVMRNCKRRREQLSAIVQMKNTAKKH